MKLRRRAVLKWTGAGVCALICAVWCASGWSRAWILHRGSGVDCHVGWIDGTLAGGWQDSQPALTVKIPKGWSMGTAPASSPLGWQWLPRWSSSSQEGNRHEQVSLPLFLPLVALSAFTVWMFYCDRRSVRWAREGRCPKCGYSLSDLPPGGACPECGKVRHE
jgi:hypothetical protein